jgi:histidinol-phosphate aminotransferase
LNGYQIHSINIINQSTVGSLDQYLELLRNSPPSVVVLSNPNGVTGLCVEPENMLIIAETCLQQKHFFIIDEAYSAFYQLDHRPLLKDYPNILILKSFSKSHGIAGLRFAAAFGNPEAILCIRKTGIENAISSISISYYLFLLSQSERISKIQQDILLSKSVFTTFISKEFPHWECFATATHFCTIDVKSEAVAHALVAEFKQNDVIIKFLGDVSKLTTCIRITMVELAYMEKIFTIFQHYRINQASYVETI